MSRLITIILVASISISILLRLVLGRERSLKIEQLSAVLFGIDEHPINKKKNIKKNLFFKEVIFIYKILNENYNNDT